MKKLTLILSLLPFLSVPPAQAANILVNADFSTASVVNATSNISYTDTGGWSAASANFTVSGGVATVAAHWSDKFLTQTVQDDSATTGTIDFSFDYITANGGEDIYYDIYGINTDFSSFIFNTHTFSWTPSGQETALLNGTFIAASAGTDTFTTTVDFGTGYKHIVVVLGGKVGAAAEDLSFDNVFLGTAAVPEPGTYVLLLLGGIALFLVIRVRKALA